MDNVKEQELCRKIKQLEKKVAQLRISRQVLMQLLERIEREKIEIKERLEKEKKALKLQNAKYARLIFECNKRLVLLQNKNNLKNY